MRLHHCIDTNTPEHAIRWLIPDPARVADIKQFYFGCIDGIPDAEKDELMQYAFSLADAGLFRLPFDHVAYACEDDGAHFLVRAEAIGPGSFDIGVCVKFNGVPQAGYFTGAVTFHNKEGEMLACELARASMYPPPIGDGVKKEGQSTLIRATSILLLLTVMMHAKEASIRLEAAPEKLNAKRARQGRPRIEDIRHVSIRVGDTNYSMSGHAVGDRLSPRMHWRRGHIRHLPSGKITNVVPCLVGSIERGPTDRDYKVQHA